MAVRVETVAYRPPGRAVGRCPAARDAPWFRAGGVTAKVSLRIFAPTPVATKTLQQLYGKPTGYLRIFPNDFSTLTQPRTRTHSVR